MSMNQNIKAEWVENLRSGEYPQTDGKLIGPAIVENPTEEQRYTWLNDGNDDDANVKDEHVTGYCCLGVLTVQAIKSGELSTILRFDPGDEREVQVWMNPDGEVAHTPDDKDVDGQWEEFCDNDLPRCVARWAGIKDKRPGDKEALEKASTAYSAIEPYQSQPHNPRIGEHRAIARNDNMHQSFAEIADAVEADELL